MAFIGYLIKYFNDLNLSKKKSQFDIENEKLKFELDRVNQQLQYFYGPLKALNETSSIAYKGFSDKYLDTNHIEERFGQAIENKLSSLNSEEVNEEYRLWMTTVFHPIHDKMMEIILSRLDLVIEDILPRSLEKICAHVASYKPVIEKWKKGDFKESTGIILYPGDDLTEYINASFKKLKLRQQQLIKRIEK